jgi:hypothetical protein
LCAQGAAPADRDASGIDLRNGRARRAVFANAAPAAWTERVQGTLLSVFGCVRAARSRQGVTDLLQSSR